MKNNNKQSFKAYWTNRFILIFGEVLSTEKHRHHAIQVSMNSVGKATVECGDHSHTGDFVIIESGKEHSVVNDDVSIVLLINSESIEAERIRMFLDNKECISIDDVDSNIKESIIQAWHEDLSLKDVNNIYFNLLDLILGEKTVKSPLLDVRVSEAINIINNLEISAITPSEIAKKVFLSESRFQHLFKQNVGVSLSKYLLWQKTLHGIEGIISGMTITEAALAAGFSDGAHFSLDFGS